MDRKKDIQRIRDLWAVYQDQKGKPEGETAKALAEKHMANLGLSREDVFGRPKRPKQERRQQARQQSRPGPNWQQRSEHNQHHSDYGPGSHEDYYNPQARHYNNANDGPYGGRNQWETPFDPFAGRNWNIHQQRHTHSDFHGAYAPWGHMGMERPNVRRRDPNPQPKERSFVNKAADWFTEFWEEFDHQAQEQQGQTGEEFLMDFGDLAAKKLQEGKGFVNVTGQMLDAFLRNYRESKAHSEVYEHEE